MAHDPPVCQVCGQRLTAADGPSCLACQLRPGLSTAGELYARFQVSNPPEATQAFEALCSAYPESADELRRLHLAAQLDRASKSSTCTVPGEPIPRGAPAVPTTSDDLPGSPAAPDLATPSGGRYRIQGMVARGGMGVIYAVHDRELNRQVAMKVIGTNLGGGQPISLEALPPSWVDRFVEEAQITAQLDHPNIVPVHEIGIDPQGRIYFTMKLVQGRALHEIFALARQKSDGWSLARAVGVLVRACQAVAHAHERGVVHRDLKPQNIMVGRLGEVYVMDWGLAKPANRADMHDLRPRECGSTCVAPSRPESRPGAEALVTGDSPLVTLDGTILGTPAYMSPEHAEGRVEDIGVPSDVYSLGAILHELLTGHAPYLRPGLRQTPRQVLEAVRAGQPDPLESTARDQPAELVAICTKAMRRNAAARYQNAGELAEDLQAWLEGRVVRAHRTGALAELKAWILRNRLAALSQAAGVSLIVATLLAVTWAQQRSNRRLSRQVYATLVSQAADKLHAGEHSAAAGLLKNAQAEHRGWEWRHLDRWAHSWQTNVVCQEPEGLTALAVSISRGWFVTAGLDQPLRLHSVADGRLLTGFGPTNAQSLALDATGRWLVAADNAGSLSAWELPSGRLHRQWSSKARPRVLAFARDEPVFAAGDQAGSVEVWTLDADVPLATLAGRAPITAMAFASQRLLFVGDAEGGVRRWHLGSDPTAIHLGQLGAEILAVGTDAPGNRLATSSGRLRRSAGLRWWDLLEGWDQDLPIPAGFSDLRTLALDATERYLLGCAFFGHLLILDANTGRLDTVIDLGGRQSAGASFLASEAEVLTWARHGTVLRVTRPRADHVQLPGPPGQLRTLLFDRSGHRLQVASLSGTILDWQIDSQTLGNRIPIPNASLKALSRTRDGALLIAADIQGGLALLDAATGTVGPTVRTLDPTVGVWWLDLHRDDRRVAVGCTDGTVRILDLADRTWYPQHIAAHTREVEGVRFSPDGVTLATCGNDGWIALWRTSNGTPIWRKASGSRQCRSVAFSPDGQRLTHGNEDGSAHIRSVGDGHLLLPPLAGHHGRVHSAVFSPDGTRLFTGGEDGTVKVWDAELGIHLLTLPVTTRSPVWDVAISPDGTRLAASDGEGTVTVWFGDPAPSVPEG